MPEKVRKGQRNARKTPENAEKRVILIKLLKYYQWKKIDDATKFYYQAHSQLDRPTRKSKKEDRIGMELERISRNDKF